MSAIGPATGSEPPALARFGSTVCGPIEAGDGAVFAIADAESSVVVVTVDAASERPVQEKRAMVEMAIAVRISMVVVFTVLPVRDGSGR